MPGGRARAPARHGPLEICDLLGPDNELIHVKRAEGSAPLSHLFSQATLAHAARILGTYGIDVEVIGIPAA